MEREDFASRFREASERTRDFARNYIEEPLPDALLFRVRLNASYDNFALPESVRLFPQDGTAERAHELSRCTGEQVVDVLYRDGMVPEWINLSVIGEVGTATLIEVLACGRFTRDEKRLYHQHAGLPPFQVGGPALPVGHVDGRKFSVYTRSDAARRDELERIARHASKVWSLHLHGPEFDDEALASLPVFPGLHILELRGSPLRGGGLVGLGRQPKLRHFRLYLNHDDTFSASLLPKLSHLETLDIGNLPRGPWDCATVFERAPGLTWLDLSSRHDLVLDGRMRGTLDSCVLWGRRVEGDPFPRNMNLLSLHLSEASDMEIQALLTRVKGVTRLSLRGTPVGEALVEELVSRFQLEHLDVVDTRVGLECVRRIRARQPNLRMYPNLDA